jgi:AraC-like DNA-binding protein
MDTLESFIKKNPVLPYIRESDFARRKPWQVPERRLLDYLLVYIQEGECEFRIEHERILLSKGDFCLIQPNSLTHLIGLTNTVTPFAHFDIFYHPLREQSFPTRPGQIVLEAYQHLLQPRLDALLQAEVPIRFKPKYSTKFRDTFLQAVEYWQYHEPLMQIKAQAALTEIVIMILEDYLSNKPAQRPSPQTLNWITSYFSLNLSEPIEVEDMAKRANLSPSRFNDLFKHHYGMTPHQYLIHMRISHACELLLNTELGQEQIASYCGFANIHHFSKVFKQKIGTAPGQYSEQYLTS